MRPIPLSLKNIKLNKLSYKKYGSKIYGVVAKHLNDKKIIGWFQDGAEFGPRALGNRSILAKPFPSKMRDHINKNVKFREYFRPFAPAVLSEYLEEYFDIDQERESTHVNCLPKKSLLKIKFLL